MSIVEQYAGFCDSLTFEDCPESVRSKTKRLFQDYIGLTIGGYTHSPTAAPAIRGIRELYGAPEERNAATIVGTGEIAPAAYACLANGTLAHSLDFDDTVFGGHVGAPVFSAALAAAEARSVSGSRFLTGAVGGYEVMTRLLRAVNRPVHYNRGFHPTATCGVFGATAAAGIIRNLSTQEFEYAFGINASQIAGTNGYTVHGGWNKRLHPGLAAHSAHIAIALASAGVQGIAKPITGERNFFAAYTENSTPEEATRALGDEFLIMETGMKPYPCGRRIHPSIATAIDIAEEYDLAPDEIEAVELEVSSQNVHDLARPRQVKCAPSNLVAAQFSMQFGVALGLVHRDAGLSTFLNEVENGIGPSVNHVMNRITVTANDDIHPEGDPDYHAIIRVKSVDTTIERKRTTVPGNPEEPLSRAELDAKFRDLTDSIDESRRDELLSIIQSLERRPIAELSTLLRNSDTQ